VFARRSSRLIVVVEREPQRHWTDETPSRSWAPHDHGSSRYPSRYPRSGCQITRQTARRPRGTIIPSVLGASVTKFANSSGPMTILTSVTANAIWRVALTHSLAMLSAICSAKYPVWFWTPSNRPVLSLPKQRCSLKVHHPNKFRQTPPSQFCQFCDGRFLRPTLVHPPPPAHRRDISPRRFLENSSGGPTIHMVPTAYTGLERDQPPSVVCGYADLYCRHPHNFLSEISRS